MNAITTTKTELKVLGFTLKTSFKNDRNKTEIPPFFHKVLSEGKLNTVPNKLNNNQLCVFTIQKGNPDFNYIMGVEVSNYDSDFEGMDFITLPESKYVSIKTVKRGPEDVGRAFEFIFKSWIPGSIYIPTGAPAFIYYDNEFFEVFNKVGYSGNPMATVYVPIKPLFVKKTLHFLGVKKFIK